MKYITLIIGLLVAVGCSKSPEEKVVGSYEAKIDGDVVKLVLLENIKSEHEGRISEHWVNGVKGVKGRGLESEGTWKIDAKEVRVFLPIESKTENLQESRRITFLPFVRHVYKIEPNGDLTLIAEDIGERKDIPKEDQITFKKIK